MNASVCNAIQTVNDSLVFIGFLIFIIIYFEEREHGIGPFSPVQQMLINSQEESHSVLLKMVATEKYTDFKLNFFTPISQHNRERERSSM